ncbi:uncharacterized protein LOC125497509 isoform X2 [Beta vulgaris subsp. vulgaris]|uniref:uncharacterized protein LOC125497509 isoform X2 n=1 Tax=Beta vulgaris subsp. vulgaris TaxID=3555 RepID=UPI0020367DDD|nr:uncharacterized protein LOC125497509 isoform X2 [Beta vulgaris subsp. vulgaris]
MEMAALKPHHRIVKLSGQVSSCYAMMKCIHYGHEIVALANLLPVDDSIDELDSYMYQTVSFFTLLYTDTSSYFMCSYLSCYFYESRETFLLDSKCKETLSTFRLPSLS